MISANDARQGPSGHEVLYVLGFGTTGAIFAAAAAVGAYFELFLRKCKRARSCPRGSLVVRTGSCPLDGSGGAAAAFHHVLKVNRSMAPRMASVELAITRETMLRSTSNCAPSIGKMKRRPMRISIP